MQEHILRVETRGESATRDPSMSPLLRAVHDDAPGAIADLVKGGVDINTRFHGGWTGLHISSAHNQLDLVDVLLQHGADPGLRTDDDFTPLHMSATNGSEKVVEVLLRHGATLDAKGGSNGYTALHMAAEEGNEKVVKVLLCHGATLDTKGGSNGYTALHMAAANGSKEAVELLLCHGATLDAKGGSNGYTPLHVAARRGRTDALRVLIDACVNHDMNIDDPAHDGETALESGCMSDNIECVKMLVLVGANVDAVVDKLGYTPLMSAAATGRDQVAQALLDAGADIDRLHKDGMTAVALAAYFGNLNVLQTLIAGNANLDIKDRNGYTALRAAIVGGQPDTAMLLLQQRVEVKTTYGDLKATALHLAARSNYRDVAETLISKGADVDACDVDGETPLQWAVQRGLLDMTTTLLRHGAHINNNKQNEETAEAVLQSAMRHRYAPFKDLLLAGNVDINRLRSHSSNYESVLGTRKMLANIASCDNDVPEPSPRTDLPLSPIPTGSELELPTGSPKVDNTLNAAHGRIRYNVLDISGHAGAENLITESVGGFKHGVLCDGPLCKDSSEEIIGVRFKCTVCDNVDFCSACIVNFFNNHSAHHSMIRCFLPTQFHATEEIEDEIKPLILENDSAIKIENISRIIYARPKEQSLQLKIEALSGDHPKRTDLEKLLQDTTPTIFPVFRSRSGGHVSGPGSKRDIIAEGDRNRSGGLSYYKRDEAGNVRAKFYGKDEPKDMPRDDLIVHHQDIELLARVITNELKYYNYSADKTFRNWSREGRLVTRIINIKPGNFNDKLEIDIRAVDLATIPVYEALSYTWKETAYERASLSVSPESAETARKLGRYSHIVYCSDQRGNEQYLKISCGLRDALTRLRHTSETKAYWIDQLSINQQSYGERKFQVPRLAWYYNRARQVTFWVGDELDDTGEVFDIFRKIARASKNQGSPLDPNEMLADVQLELPSFTSPTWKSVSGFFDRPVFNRCWVIQEVVVGQEVVVRCGELTIPWDDLSMAVVTLNQPSWIEALPEEVLKIKRPSLLSPSVGTEGEDTTQGGLINMMLIDGFRKKFQWGKRIPLETLLYSTSLFEASDPRDKIFSILGIQSADTWNSDVQEIEADYEKPVEDIFREAARVCIIQSSSLTICGINSGPSSKRTEHLPSWVPDFTANSVDSITSLCRPVPPNPYRASGDIPLVAGWPYEERPDILVTSSCKVETITSVSHHFLSEEELLPKLVLEWTKIASIVAQYPTGESVSNAFCRTCVAKATGHLRESPMPEPLLSSLYRLFKWCFLQHVASECAVTHTAEDLVIQESDNAIIATFVNGVHNNEAAAAATSNKALLPNGDSSSNQSLLEAAGIDEVRDMIAPDSLIFTCRNSRFFVTGNGFFGIGSTDIQVGDEVHVLSGTRVPFVLRKSEPGDIEDDRTRTALEMAEGDGLRLYEMMGGSYIHGYMQGEVASRNGSEWERICIC